MNKTYFKTISLIEWIYLDKEKILLQRDWSKYFDFEIIYLWENILRVGIKKNLKKSESSDLIAKDINKLINQINKDFIEWLKKNLKDHQSLYDIVNKKFIFDVLDKEEKVLTKREYWFNLNKTNNFLHYKELFKSLLKSYFLMFKYSIDKNIIFSFNEENLDFCINRFFNFKSFFLQNEALFDTNNDFFNNWQNSKKIRTLVWKLKENKDNWKKEYLQTIENRIKIWEIKEEHIFRVEVTFSEDLLKELNLKISDLEQNKKEYNFLFFERNDYLVFDVKK